MDGSDRFVLGGLAALGVALVVSLVREIVADRRKRRGRWK